MKKGNVRNKRKEIREKWINPDGAMGRIGEITGARTQYTISSRNNDRS
jgi:hypothetical protein